MTSPELTGTAALLAAVDIWSTGPAAVPVEPKTPASVPAEPELPAPPTAAEIPAQPETSPSITPEPKPPMPPAPAAAEAKRLSPSARLAAVGSAASYRQYTTTPSPSLPAKKLSLALQGGGSFGAFTWGVLDRLLDEGDCTLGAISGASAGAVNGVLLACGLVEGGRRGAQSRLRRFWTRMTNDASFRSLMLVGGFSPVGSSVAFGPALRSGQFDPFDLDPLRQVLAQEIDFAALRAPDCPKLLVAATRVRDGAAQIFRNADITADVVLASTCPPLVHCAVEIAGESYWDGGYAANPPVVSLVHESDATDLLVVQATPARDRYIPMTMAAIDRRLDQIMANSTLNAEIAALELLRDVASMRVRVSRIAAEDEIEGLAQRSAVDLSRSSIELLHRSGYTAADRWLEQEKPVELGAPLRLPAVREPVEA